MFKFKKYAFIAILALFIFFTQSAKADVEEFFGIGAKLLKDKYSNKVFIVEILNNSPAQATGLTVGDEITEVNGEKVKKLSSCEIVSKIRGDENTKVVLTIKKSFFKREKIELTRQKICYETYSQKSFDSHWVQIATGCYMNPELLPQEVIKKLSRRYKKEFVAKNDYWFNRKQVFQSGFNACMEYSKNNQETCLIHLMDRESAKTNTDKVLYKFLR